MVPSPPLPTVVPRTVEAEGAITGAQLRGHGLPLEQSAAASPLFQSPLQPPQFQSPLQQPPLFQMPPLQPPPPFQTPPPFLPAQTVLMINREDVTRY